MHEHVKKSIQPHNERGQFNYPSTDHPSPDDDPRQPPLTTPPDLAPDSHTRHPNSEEWKYHEGAPLYQQEGEGLGHTPNPPVSDYHPAGVGVYPGSGDGEFKDEEGGGEEGRWSRGGGEEWRRDGGGSGVGGGGGGGEEEGREDGGRRKESVGGTYDQDLPSQMSRMRLMEPSHYSTPAYPAGAASAGAAGFVSESHSQLSMPHSSSYTMATQGHGPQERGYRRVSEEVPPQLSGETAEVAAMKEKIRQLEAQLAEEKRKQYSGPQPQQPSPVHTAQLYQEARPPRYSGPVQYSSSPVQVRGSSSGTVIGLPHNPGHLCYAIHPFFPFLPSSISYFFSSLPPPLPPFHLPPYRCRCSRQLQYSHSTPTMPRPRPPLPTRTIGVGLRVGTTLGSLPVSRPHHLEQGSSCSRLGAGSSMCSRHSLSQCRSVCVLWTELMMH